MDEHLSRQRLAQGTVDMLELDITTKHVEESTRVDLKKTVKVSATNASFKELKRKLMKH